MILSSLSLTNFKRYTSYEQSFEDGLTGVIGRNGSGKSTIFEAIYFALYGDLKGGKALVRTAGVSEKEPVIVELLFEMEGRAYTVQREFRSKALTAYASLKDYEGGELASGAKEVTRSITKLIGMNKDAFLNTVFASQKELTALSSLDNETRKKMMRRLLGLEKIDAIEAMIRDEIRELGRDIKSAGIYLLSNDEEESKEEQKKAKSQELKLIDKQVIQSEKAYELLNKKLQSAKEELKKLQILKDELTQQANNLSLMQKERELKSEQLKKSQETLLALQETEKKYKLNLPKKAAFQTLERSLTEFEKTKVLITKKQGLEKEQTQLRIDYKNAQESIARLQKEIEPLAIHKKSYKKETDELKKLEMTQQSFDKEIRTLHESIAANRSKIEDVKTKITTITELGSESACPVCTRPLLEQYDTVISSLDKEITDVYKKAIETAQKELDEKQKAKTTLDEALKTKEKLIAQIDKQITLIGSKSLDLKKAQGTFEEVNKRGLQNKEELKKLESVTYDSKAHESAQKEFITLKPEYEALLQTEERLKEIPKLQETITSLQTAITSKEEESKKLQALIKNHPYNEKTHQAAQKSSDQQDKAKETKAAELSILKVNKTKLTAQIEAITKELEKNKKQKAALALKQNDLNDYEKLKVVMKEFKTGINGRIAPRISQIASEMFARITRGKYQHIEVSPEFDFFIFDEGEQYPIERFSGGEIDLANLVLRIAISRTLGELSGSKQVGFLAFDEVFGSQDEERRIEIMEAFHMISESYRQIFLISHEMEIKELFERVVEL